MIKKCIIITSVTFVVLLLLTSVLPNQIPINMGIGKKMDISVYFILLFTPLPTFCYWSNLRKKKKMEETKHE